MVPLEALWARLERTTFLTTNEKRAAVGYEPIETLVSDAPGQTPSPLLKYSPTQPRVSPGNSDGGQWTDGGGGSSASGGSGSDGRVLSDASPDDFSKPGTQLAASSGNQGPKILGRGPKDFGQRVNTPNAKDIQLRMGHILEGHTVQGSAYKTSIRDNGGKTAFPERMTPKDIEKAVREAYSNSREVSSPQYSPDGKIRLLEGESGGIKIRMYYNSEKKTIDSAFPRK